MFSNLKNFFFVPLIFVLFQTSMVFCQDSDYIYGKIVDAKSKIEIPFATIKLKNKSIGLISNADGGFKIPSYYSQVTDTLVISFLGYNSREISISSLQKNQVNLIQLTEKVENLKEVVIQASRKKLRARRIVKLALNSIKENYPFSPFSYVGYYRDYQVKDDTYVNLNEAILEVFDPGFHKIDIEETETRIFEYKKNLDFDIDSVASQPYDYVNRTKIIDNATINGIGGNEYSILRLHDAIRNYKINTYDFVNTFQTDFLKNHRFKLLGNILLDDIPLYKIQVSKNLKQHKVVGEIYIGKGDFKIYKFQYAVYEKAIEYRYAPTQPMGVSQEFISSDQKLVFNITLEYSSYGDMMYPNYISFNNAFDVLQPPKFIPTKAIVNSDKRRFEIIFNNVVAPKEARKKKNYKISYQELPISIDSLHIQKDRVIIYPDDPKFIFDRGRIEKRRTLSAKGITLRVTNIRDVDGNIVYEQESESYNQFREFFVQELKIGTVKPRDSLFMIKNRPIFVNQPIVTPYQKSKYWMNTPLKN